MFSRIIAAAAPLALLAAVPAEAAAPPQRSNVTPDQMRRHIEVLASDAFEGRKPGTPGEIKTLAYMLDQFQKLGLEPAGRQGSWLQPVPLVSRKGVSQRATFTGSGVPLTNDEIVLIGSDTSERIADAPVWFVGSGADDAIAGADLTGAVVLLQFDSKTAQDYEARAQALRKAGAAAVIMVLGQEVPWAAVSGSFRRGRDQLDAGSVPEIQGAMSHSAGSRLIGEQRLASAADASFRAVRLPVRASLDVTTEVRRYVSYNLLGRLRGSGSTGENVLLLGHWDHLGICRPEGAPDRICNGAVDNASGMAMMIEAARHLSIGPRPQRDILFLATTAEEIGLLGAEHFATEAVVPLKSIVGAINMDTVAITPRGEPVATIGRGTTGMDPLIERTAEELGRCVDRDEEANVMITRQDGWALAGRGIPTVMIGGSFSDMAKLQAYLAGPYHKPEDDLKQTLMLDGAAEDTDLLIALVRKLADPKQYRPAAR